MAWSHSEHAAVAAVTLEAVRAARAPLLDLAILLVWLGNHLEIAGAWRGWQRLADEALAAAEDSGEHGAAPYARTGLAGAAYRRGDIDGSLAHCRAALEYLRSVADHSRQARLHNLMAVALGDRGRHAEQRQHLYPAYDLHALAGEVRSQAVVPDQPRRATQQHRTARAVLGVRIRRALPQIAAKLGGGEQVVVAGGLWVVPGAQ
ncbi:hypothetical protein [Plantactinospora sp. CA-290183]|uniref:hypothetical protein n=1 Tax=Plantactinospora sp. CA-290183 TaxID=3240006 RepID=UPI003D8A28FF